jgi:hypothetical protein
MINEDYIILGVYILVFFVSLSIIYSLSKALGKRIIFKVDKWAQDDFEELHCINPMEEAYL